MSFFDGFDFGCSVPVQVPSGITPKVHLVVPTVVALGIRLKIFLEVPRKLLVFSSGI